MKTRIHDSMYLQIQRQEAMKGRNFKNVYAPTSARTLVELTYLLTRSPLVYFNESDVSFIIYETGNLIHKID